MALTSVMVPPIAHCRSALYVFLTNVLFSSACMITFVLDTQAQDIRNEQPRSVVVTHHAVMNTSKGTIKFALYGKDAPHTVDNFIKLAQKGFYRNIKFHRIAKDFVIQAGDPLTKDSKRVQDWGLGGESSTGGTFADELHPNTPSYINGYRRGVLAMANRGPNTNTSQFFICLRNVPELPKTSTIFGIVIEGIDVVQAIAALDIEPVLNDRDGRPLVAPTIRSIKIIKL